MKRNQSGFGVIEIIIAVVVGGLLMGTTFWFVSSSQSDEPAASDSAQSDESSSAASEAGSAAPAESTPASTIEPTYTPANLFSSSEKATLNDKLIQPNIDYAEQYKDKPEYNPVSAITVTKYTDSEYATQPAYAKYRYKVDVAYKTGEGGFLYAEDDVIDWWLPECFDGACNLTETFKTKYPEIVNKLTVAGNTP